MSNTNNIAGFTDVLEDEIGDSQESQPLSLSSEHNNVENLIKTVHKDITSIQRPAKGTGQYGQFRSIEEIPEKYRDVFGYQYFNIVQSGVIEDALYSDKSMVVCAPTGSGKTVVFEMAIVQLLMELEDKQCDDDFKIIYMAPVKALCTERLTEWYPKFTKLGLMCIEVTGDTNVDFTQLKPYRIIITTPEKWDMVTRRWREHSQLVEVIKLFLIDEVHILNDASRGPVLEAVVSRMKTIESSAQSAHRIEQLRNQYQGTEPASRQSPPQIRFIAVSATVSNPEDVAAWLGSSDRPAVYYRFGDECRPVKLKRVVEGYPCPEGTSIFKFDIALNYKLWPVIQKYHDGKPTLIFCNTRKSVALTAETLYNVLTISFNDEQKAKLTAIASRIKNKKLQALVLSGVGCHHAGLLFEERICIEQAFRNRDLPILITTTTLAMGVNLPAHLVIIKNTQQYVNGAYQEYSISTILQMVGRAGRPQFDTEATAVIMTRLVDKSRYQALVGGSEPLQSYLHKRIAENLNSEAALCTVNDVAQGVQWLRSTFLYVRAAKDPRRYLGLSNNAPQKLILEKLEELCVKAINGLVTAGLLTMDESSCIESTEAGRLMSIFYLDVETMKLIMKITGTETLDRLLWLTCESHELADMHLRVDERRCLNLLNRNNAAATIRFPMKGKITTRQMKHYCIIQAVLGCLPIPDPSLNQEAMKVMRIAQRICKCLVAYVTRKALISEQPKFYLAVLNSLILEKCVTSHLWENSPYVSKQLKGIGPTFSTLLATAGKVNFMLLEESHPRDLERIMNKGPPAGNVLRKQISLIPKYQLTMTPIDEKSVSIQLSLLNYNYLAENMDNLTTGVTHKAYLVVGDSENNLLLLTWFTDRDLIRVYDGTITHQITRKLCFEHKVFAQCVSSSFVGIDAHNEYVFKVLESAISVRSDNVDFIRPANKQTVITDTFTERKRKNTEDITQSKEKKKRDSTLIEKFKEKFGKTSTEHLKTSEEENLDKSATMSNKIIQGLTHNHHNNSGTPTNSIIGISPGNEIVAPIVNNSAIHERGEEIIVDDDDFIDDENIDSIMNDIENEISKINKSVSPRIHQSAAKNTSSNIQVASVKPRIPKIKKIAMDNYNLLNNPKRRGNKNTKSNFNFIDALEKKMQLSLEESRTPANNTESGNNTTGLSETIKNQLRKYVKQTKRNVPHTPTELLKPNDTTNEECDNSAEQNQQIPECQLDTDNDQNCLNDSKQIVEEKHVKLNSHGQHENIDSENINDTGTAVTNETAVSQNINTTLNSHVETNDLVIQDYDNNGVISNLPILSEEEKTFENLILIQDSENDNDLVDNNQGLNNNMSLILHDDNNLLISTTNGNQPPNTNYLKPTTEFKEQVENQRESLVVFPSIYQSNLACLEPANTTSTFTENRNHYQSQLSIDNRAVTTPTFIRDNNPNRNDNNARPNYTRQNTKDIISRNHNEKIRKYSYSNTKIDVASTSTDNSVIQIIRKVKMDLDITEIISEKTKVNSDNVGKQKQELNTRKRLESNLFNPLEDYTNPDENINALVPLNERNMRKCDKILRNTAYTPKQLEHHKSQLEILTKAITTCNERNMIQSHKDMDKSLEYYLPKASVQYNQVVPYYNDTYTGKYHEIVQNKTPVELVPEERITKVKTAQLKGPSLILRNEARHNINTNTSDLNKVDNSSDLGKEHLNTSEVDKILTLQKEAHHYTNTSDLKKGNNSSDLDKEHSTTSEIDKITSNTEKNTNSDHRGNKVNHILQKYSKMLRKPNKNPALTHSQTKTEDKELNKPKEKIKRPFKITNIHNIDAPLPKTLISELSKRETTLTQHTEEQKQTLLQKEDQEVYLNINTSQKQLEFINESNFNEYKFQNDTAIENLNETLPELELPAITLLETTPENEFKIDQTMFDPKMVLQSIGNDDLKDLIVPPPPEFGDETKLTQEINNSLISTDCYEPMQWNYFENDYTTQQSYMEESQVDLTPSPSRQIETWTLSQNDESYDNLSNPSISYAPLISYPDMFEDPARRNSPFQTVAPLTRNNKLGRFKFSGKKKLKL